MPNIKFSYLYRDGGNYKKFHSVIFSNPSNTDISELEKLIRSKLIDGLWFYADKWDLPDLHFDMWDKDLDHCFHEFENVEYTEKQIGDKWNIEDFMSIVSSPQGPLRETLRRR